MNVGEWTGVAALAVAVLGTGGTWLRGAMNHGSVTKSVSELEKWKETRSIDRAEFDDHNRRLILCEGQAAKLAEVDKSLGVLKADFDGFRALHTRDFDEIKHGQRNLAASIDSLAAQIGLFMPRVRSRARPASAEGEAR